MVAINANSAAVKSQQDLETANTSMQHSISRLSSGNRIATPSDDVAGLAVGTVLNTNIIVLNAVYTNTTQAASLLGLADAAVSNVNEILQRQKAIATQATSGSLDATARSFLNQEFQNLREELDRIANSTNFNNIKLLDGSLYNPSTIETKTTADANNAKGNLQIAIGAGIGNGETLTITSGGISVAFTGISGAASAYPASLLQIPTTLTDSALASAIYDRVQAIVNYSGNDTTILQARKLFSGLKLNINNNSINITAVGAGTLHNNISFALSGGTSNDMTLSSQDIAAGASASLGGTGILATDGALNAGGFSSGTQAYSDNGVDPVPTVYAQGSVSDSIIKSIVINSQAATGINPANISNNPYFIGQISGFNVSLISDQVVDISVNIGGIEYIAQGVNTNYATDTIITFTANDPSFGSFDLQFAGGGGIATVRNENEASVFAARLNAALEKVDFYQKREITSYMGAGTVYPAGNNVAIGNLSGSKFWLISDSFDDIEIQDVKITAPVIGSTEALIEFVINGNTYKSGYDYDGSVRALGSTISNTSGGNGDGIISFVNQTNPNSILVMQYASTQALTMVEQADAQGLEQALKIAFNIGKEGGQTAGLIFQVGIGSADTINVQIGSTKQEDLYINERGIYQEDLAVNTQENAMQANDILDTAINKAIAIRANIGALQSRFEYAALNIESSIENQDAARSLFLDTNISVESTNFAKLYVQVQASVSVLAQANQLPQTLLKLVE